MATSAYPSLATQTPMTQMMAHSALKMSEAAGLLVPPIYVAASLISAARGRGASLSVRGLMRASTRGVVISAPLGAGAAWAMLRNEPAEAVEDRCYRLAHSPTQIQVDDYSLIGAALGAVIAPALLLRRAPFAALVLGGASIGLGAGAATHIAKMAGGGEKVKPEGMVGEIPIVGGNK